MPDIRDVAARGKLFKAYQVAKHTSVVSYATGEEKVQLAFAGDWVVMDSYMNLVVMTDKHFKELFSDKQAR